MTQEEELRLVRVLLLTATNALAVYANRDNWRGDSVGKLTFRKAGWATAGENGWDSADAALKMIRAQAPGDGDELRKMRELLDAQIARGDRRPSTLANARALKSESDKEYNKRLTAVERVEEMKDDRIAAGVLLGAKVARSEVVRLRTGIRNIRAYASLDSGMFRLLNGLLTEEDPTGSGVK